MEIVSRSRCAKPATEVFIVDGSPAAALAVGAHRPSQESTYVLSRAVNEQSEEFRERVLRRAARIQARQDIGSLWYVVGSPGVDGASSVQLLKELLPLLSSGSRVTLATPRRHGRVVFSWLDELLGHGGADVGLGVQFYSDAPTPPLRRGALTSPPEPSLQCA